MNSKGFTLIEMVMVILLLGIIAGVATMVLLEGSKGWLAIGPRKDALWEARMSIERMVREAREGRRYNYTIAANQITFRRHTSTSLTTYQYNAGRLERTEGGITSALAGNVEFLRFTTIKPNLIGITLGMSEAGKTVELRSRVFFRNYTRTE